MGSSALIGYTGFVGSELMRQMPFDATFNSKNIQDIRGGSFDLVVCAGVSAVKWLANKEPDKDWQGIERLLQPLAEVRAGRFVLISTIDVYRTPERLTERDIPTRLGLHPYGLHRLKVEDFVRDHFPSHTIVRLPALFGRGLKKNVIYDMMHSNQTEKIVPNARFQWYPTRRLAHDLAVVLGADIDLINVTAEPVATAEIRDRCFPGVTIGAEMAEPPGYDLLTVHDTLLGGAAGYHLSRGQVLDEIARFVDETARA